MKRQYNKNILIKNLRRMRDFGDVTQDQLARYLRIKRPMYAAYEERGRNEPGLKVLVRISNFYNIPINDMATRVIEAKEFFKANKHLLGK